MPRGGVSIGRMRLREIRDGVRLALDLLGGAKATDVQLASGQPGVRITEIGKVAEGLSILKTLPLGPEIGRRIDAAQKHELLAEVREGLQVLPAPWTELTRRIEQIRDPLGATLSALSAMVPPARPGTFAIRMPESSDGLDTMASDVAILAKAIQQPLLRLGCESFEIVGVDRGSSWIEFLVPAKWIAIVELLRRGWALYRDVRDGVRRSNAESLKSAAELKLLEAQTDAARASAENQREQAGLARTLEALAEQTLRRSREEIAAEIVNAVVVDDESRLRVDNEVRTFVVQAIELGADQLERGADLIPLLEGPRAVEAARERALPSPPAALPEGTKKP